MEPFLLLYGLMKSSFVLSHFILLLSLVFSIGSATAFYEVGAGEAPNTPESTTDLEADTIKTKVRLNLRSSPVFQKGLKYHRNNIMMTLKKGDELKVLDRTTKGHFLVQTPYKDDKGKPIIGYVFNSPRYIEIFDVNNSPDRPPVPRVTPKNLSFGSNGQIILPLCGCTSPRCRLSSPYGYRRHPIFGDRRFHAGIDLPGVQGQTIVRASADGVVKTIRRNYGGYGTSVQIQHNFPLKTNRGYLLRMSKKRGFGTRYSHLHKFFVKHGQKVKKGQPIGLVGSTGRATGPHLDFSVIAGGKTHDPMTFLPKDSISYKRE